MLPALRLLCVALLASAPSIAFADPAPCGLDPLHLAVLKNKRVDSYCIDSGVGANVEAGLRPCNQSNPAQLWWFTIERGPADTPFGGVPLFSLELQELQCPYAPYKPKFLCLTAVGSGLIYLNEFPVLMRNCRPDGEGLSTQQWRAVNANGGVKIVFGGGIQGLDSPSRTVHPYLRFCLEMNIQDAVRSAAGLEGGLMARLCDDNSDGQIWRPTPVFGADF